jgi:hypothetical protein
MNTSEAKQFGIPEDEQRGYIRLDRAKLNSARTTGKTTWFRLVGVDLGNGNETYPKGDEVQTAEIWNPPETWAGISKGTLDAILNTIDDGPGDGNFYSAHNSAGADRAAWGVIRRFAPDKSEDEARVMVASWLKSGLLYKFSYQNPQTRKQVKGVKVNNHKRPTKASS